MPCMYWQVQRSDHARATHGVGHFINSLHVQLNSLNSTEDHPLTCYIVPTCMPRTLLLAGACEWMM